VGFLEDKIRTFFKGMGGSNLCARLCPQCFKLFWGTDSCQKELCGMCLKLNERPPSNHVGNS
jgi:hypothetical protein